MKRLSLSRFRRCGHAPGALTLEDQAAIDAFQAMLAALRDAESWTPGRCEDIAVRVGPFVERAHPRPGDDHGPDLIAIALQHPGGSYTPYGDRYRRLGWLRCETDKILGMWNPAYAPLTHAAAGLNLPDDVGMTAANYAVHVEARRPDNTGHIVLRLGPYNQTWLADHDADRLNTALAGKAATAIPGFTVVAKGALFDVSDHGTYDDPYATDPTALLAAAITREVSA
ncbi:hypothetical protein [Streptomyces sp. NPDC058614]|uniref:hypothetical protein n=1 Tax=Streptomyces sp. NPDC058614 TaxID=3346557 RepID=UPI0036590963